MEKQDILLNDEFHENDVIEKNELCDEKNLNIDNENIVQDDIEDKDIEDNEDDEDNEDEDDEDDDNEDDNEDDEDETTIYVICINDIPYFYEDNYEDAKKKINTFSEKIILGHKQTYDSYCKIVDEDEIHIILNLDFILFKYNYTFYKIKIHTARKYK